MTVESVTKGERTSQAVLDAAYELFMQHGFHATSMRQIAEEAELALGGIYNHFSSKEEIFAAILFDKHPYKQILPHILAAEGETTEEFIHQAAKAMVSELRKQPNLLKLMFIELVEFNGKHIPLLFREIAPKILPVFERLARMHKDLRPIHPVVLLRSFLGMFFSFFVTELFIGGAFGKLMPKNSFEVFVDIYLHGVLKKEAA